MVSHSIFDTPLSTLSSACNTTPLSSWSAHSRESSGKPDIFSPHVLPRSWLSTCQPEKDLHSRFSAVESRLFQIESQLKTTNSLLERLLAQESRPDTPDPFNPFQNGYGPLDYVPPGASQFPQAVLHFDAVTPTTTVPARRPSLQAPQSSAPLSAVTSSPSKLDLSAKVIAPPKPSMQSIQNMQSTQSMQSMPCKPSEPAKPPVPYAVAAKSATAATPVTCPLASPFYPREKVWSEKRSEAPATPRPMTLARSIIVHDSAEASISLQQELKSCNADVKKGAIASVAQNIIPLSLHRYGNYVVQRALTMDPSMAWMLLGSTVTLSLSPNGTYVLQSAIDVCSKIATAVAEQLLSSRLYHSLTSRHAMHIWRKLVDSKLPGDSISSVAAAVHRVLRGRVFDTITQEVGSLVFQALIEGGIVKLSSELVGEVFANFKDAACNQWGVWVIQSLVQHGDEAIMSKCCALVLRDAAAISLSQYGAKAVQAVLRVCDESFRREYAAILCAPHRESARPLLIDLGTLSHGLHIVTTLLTSCPSDVRSSIVHLVRSNSAFLKGNKIGVRLFQLCERARAFTGY
ncbi:hypothetical protein MCUN1_001385 [Malassezia cuniculi]|uniref:PUM-HD domain-containing protein n=1 Tax=Malassezia cuniculi TaxID=948313 RepID=A0AAF0J6G9_9BASI|nr:hypothetical protein MCUN1_001385 [Malassezia cuniculi]